MFRKNEVTKAKTPYSLKSLYSLLIAVLCICSCTGENNTFDNNNTKLLNFLVSVPIWKNNDSISNSKTRAMPISGNSLGISSSFNMIADAYDGINSYSNIINNETVSFTNNMWKTATPHYWPGTANKTMNFYAYYPTTIQAGSITHSVGSSPILSYTIPDDVSKQIDIMTSSNTGLSGVTYSSAPLTFKHVFAAINFSIGSSGMPNGTIKQITLNNIQYIGDYTFSGSWNPNTSSLKSFSQTVSASSNTGTSITSGATTFMMMPQTLNSNASITVTYTNNGTLTKTISGTWEAGKIYTYNISKTIPMATFDYTGGVQTYTVPLTGTYKLEVWGAQGGGAWGGGNTTDGYGGYSYGNIKFATGQSIFIYLGQQAGTYNGGGAGAAPGGGATHIAITNRGELKNYLSYQSEVLIVAGGGGGLEWGGKGGDGGGVSGNNGNSQANSAYSQSASATGGTQSSGGISTAPSSAIWSGTSTLVNGSFGQGGYGYTYTGVENDYGGGGGGGWYGGGGTSYSGAAGGGSGHLGSSLINGSTGMQNGIRTGNGYARITFISAN